MRIYLPATLSDFRAENLNPPLVHGVTPALVRVTAGEDEEVQELIAFLAAADDSVRLIASRNDTPRRVVVAADVPDVQLDGTPPGQLETALLLVTPVTWEMVAAVHVDETESSATVAAAAGGDDAAFERLGEVDLLWYDASELADLRHEHGAN